MKTPTSGPIASRTIFCRRAASNSVCSSTSNGPGGACSAGPARYKRRVRFSNRCKTKGAVMRTLTRLVAVLTWVVLLPAVASAQGSMVGVVKDTSGAVLPGVTVEAASPALIEKVRSVVTDGTGQYTIASLVPGTYSLTFTLPGFSTVKREGIELTGTFTAKVDAELRVGTVAETITVTGETPVVDVQSTTRERVMDRQIIDTIPAGRTAYNLGVLVPGVTLGGTNVVQDVGGSGGTPVGGQPGTGA